MYTKIFDPDDFFFGCKSLQELSLRLKETSEFCQQMMKDGVTLSQEDFCYILKTKNKDIADKYYFDNEEDEESLW